MISVVISTYRRPEQLKKAINSVLAQTYTDYEVLAVHDGLGGCLEEVNDPRVRYIDIEHFGNHSRPKNEGILQSKGEYIAFLDDDNTWRPDHLQALINAFKDNPTLDIAYADRWVIDEDGKGQLGVTSDFNPFVLMQRNFIDTSDFLIKREAMFALGGWDESEKRMLDWQLMIRAAKAGMKFHHVPLVLTDYYRHGKDQLSFSKDGLGPDGLPTWSIPDCLIELPYLGEVKEPRVAIFSLTYDRLEETKVGFESLQRTAGYPYYHYVVDNGSQDGTPEYLEQQVKDKKITALIYNKANKGISIASNQALDEIMTQHERYGSTADDHKYDIIMKVDNDCVFLSDGWLKEMVEIWKRNHITALSCYVQGLKDNPGGAERVGFGEINGQYIGITKHLGGICHFVDASAYDNFRWNEDSFYHGIQDLEFSRYLTSIGYQMAYLENYFCNHGVDGTEGQMSRFKDYFERRQLEKSTKPDGVTRSYKQLQEEESAYSRGTVWGDRIKDSIEKYGSYLQGKVLDIGCGDGLGVELIKELGHECAGIDISTPKVTLAQEKGLDAVEGVVEELPFEDKQFDTVFCSHTLEHAEDLAKACSEIQRVSRRAVIIVPIEEHTDNPGHTSPIKSKDYLLSHFKDVTILHEEELGRLEQEQVLVLEWK